MQSFAIVEVEEHAGSGRQGRLYFMPNATAVCPWFFHVTDQLWFVRQQSWTMPSSLGPEP